MIIVDDERVKIKGSEAEVAEDFASIVIVLRDGLGKERLAKLFTSTLLFEPGSDEGREL